MKKSLTIRQGSYFFNILKLVGITVLNAKNFSSNTMKKYN